MVAADPDRSRRSCPEHPPRRLLHAIAEHTLHGGGGWKNSAGEQFTLAYRYTGSTWTLQSTPNPSGSAESVLQDISCATETSCTAAGSWIESGGGSTQTLAEKWNGTSWSIQGTSNPSGSAFSALFGVSCRGTTCVGVGWSANTSGVETTLGEIRE